MTKKELAKGFKIIIDDLLDNYDKYTDEEKSQIKEIFTKKSRYDYCCACGCYNVVYCPTRQAVSFLF